MRRYFSLVLIHANILQKKGLVYQKKRKKELIEKAELAEFVQTRQYIYQLIDILDAYLQKRESGCNPMVMAYIENEINNIVRKIEQLQGTKHIDLAI